MRIPEWCDDYFVDGKSCETRTENGYVFLKKRWENHEKVRLHFEYNVKMHKLKNKIAFTYGPLVLSRNSKKEFGKNIMEELTNTDSFTAKKLKQTGDELARFEVLAGGKSILLTDYQSCGKEWINNDDLVSVWLNYKK